MSTEKQLLEGKISEQTLVLEIKTKAMAIVTETLVINCLKKLDKEPSGNAVSDAYALTKTMHSLANVLNESRYELEIQAEKIENLQCDLINLSE